ncbi:MAG: hypothetical protein AAFR33_06160 [Pseudomonadota bacterium]
MSKDDFFIGWAETPKSDRRFFLGAGLALLAGTAVTAGGVAALQRRAGPGDWAMGDIREWRGIATSEPYAMLRTLDLDGTPRTALLGCQGKCGVAARIGALEGQPVVVKGSLIQRGPHAMIAVIDGMDWIEADPAGTTADLAFPEPEPLTEVSLSGEILDSKCWFGAMRPSEGKVHKSCASLCIRGGIPPAFYVKDRAEQTALMIMTDQGAAHAESLLEYVADPVSISGQVLHFGDLLLLDAPVSAISRLTA